MAIAESNIYALWAAKQAAQGTAAADGAAARQFIQVAGDISPERADGSEAWSDLDRFGDATDFVDTLIGTGAPTIQATHSELAWLCWLFFGGEVFTAGSAVAASEAPAKHEFVPGANTGFWSTWWKRVGMSEIVRQKFVDCKVTALRIEGSTANKVVKVIPSITSLDPANTIAADPTGASLPSGEQAFLYTDGEGRFNIDGTVYRGHSQFAIVVDDGQAPYYADSARPHALVAGGASIVLEGITLVLDEDSHALYNAQVYGDPAPAPGTQPITDLPALGSYEIDLRKNYVADGSAGAELRTGLQIEVPGVRWSPDVAIAPSPDGGPIEVALGGGMRKVAGQPAIRVTVETGTDDNAAYA